MNKVSAVALVVVACVAIASVKVPAADDIDLVNDEVARTIKGGNCGNYKGTVYSCGGSKTPHDGIPNRSCGLLTELVPDSSGPIRAKDVETGIGDCVVCGIECALGKQRESAAKPCVE